MTLHISQTYPGYPLKTDVHRRGWTCPPDGHRPRGNRARQSQGGEFNAFTQSTETVGICPLHKGTCLSLRTEGEAVGGSHTVFSNTKTADANIFKPKVKCPGLCKLGTCSEWFWAPSHRPQSAGTQHSLSLWKPSGLPFSQHAKKDLECYRK